MSVYFARVKSYVKIGYSVNPESRATTITTGSCLKPNDVFYGDEINLLGWVDGDRKREREIHARFADLRIVGEWFWDTDEFDTFIADDPRGVIYFETSDLARHLLREHPWATRAQAEQAVTEATTEPSSEALELHRIFGGPERIAEWVGDIGAQMKAERDSDRAYWRSVRTEVSA